MWNVITADKYTFFSLRGILLSVFFEVCTGAGPVDALEVQSSNSNTKVSRVSQFISFTSSIEVANYYRNKFGSTLRIATVDIQKIPQQCTLIDLTTATNRDKYLGNAVCKNFAKASCEVLLSCREARVPCTIDSNVYEPPIARDVSEL